MALSSQTLFPDSEEVALAGVLAKLGKSSVERVSEADPGRPGPAGLLSCGECVLVPKGSTMS